MVAWVMDRAAPPPPGRHAFMVQRRGHIGKLYNVGPAWLKDLWIDVMETVDDGSLELVESMDRWGGGRGAGGGQRACQGSDVG